MDPTPKPGSLLIVNSVVVIGLCAFLVSLSLGAVLIPTKIPLVAWVLVFLAPAAYWQYRGAFCRDRRAAERAGGLLLFFMGVFIASAIDVGIAVAQAPSALSWVPLGATAALSAYLPFVVWLDFRWSKSLSSESCRRPHGPQFSIRDLLAMTIWIAVVAGMTRWMVLAAR